MLQAPLPLTVEPHALAPALPEASNAHPADAVGEALGWDHARHGLLPPAAHLLPGNPVREGWERGRRVFAQRPQQAGPNVGIWLHLRLQAWLHGRGFEEWMLTPHYLGQLRVKQCPVTREPLAALPGSTAAQSEPDQEGVPARIARLCAEGDYAAGHLVMMSDRAARAMAGRQWQDALALAALAQTCPEADIHGLDAPAWGRLACLMSLVTPLTHEQAAALPLRVLPPNRLRLLNPIQGLQALITWQLAQPGFARRLGQLADLLPQAVSRADFHRVVHALLPKAWGSSRPLTSTQWRHRLEDAWVDGRLLQCWQRFALQLDADQAEHVVAAAARLGLAPQDQRVHIHGEQQATEAWAPEGRTAEAAASPAPTQRTALPLTRRSAKTGARAAPGAAMR